MGAACEEQGTSTASDVLIETIHACVGVIVLTTDIHGVTAPKVQEVSLKELL